MTVRAIELSEANALIASHHRHHKPVKGHRFSLGAFKDGALVGAAVVGRPVSRECDQRRWLEVTRLVTDGTKNACSALYAAAARAGKALGYLKIQTYILATEPGTSLRASGWEVEGTVDGRSWQGRKQGTEGRFWDMRRDDQPTCDKVRWVKVLNDAAPARIDAALGEG